MLQHGLFPSLLFMNQRSIGRGLDGFRPTPESLSVSHRMETAHKYNSSAGRPPVYLIYGDRDDKVQKFDRTVEILRRATAGREGEGDGEVVVEVREGADHGFDEKPEEDCEAFRQWLGRVLL